MIQLQNNYKQINEKLYYFHTISQKIIALDDVRVLTDCPQKTDRFCDFEQSEICGYNITGNFQWKRTTRNALSSQDLFPLSGDQ
jgi:hypothetical protein